MSKRARQGTGNAEHLAETTRTLNTALHLHLQKAQLSQTLRAMHMSLNISLSHSRSLKVIWN